MNVDYMGMEPQGKATDEEMEKFEKAKNMAAQQAKDTAPDQRKAVGLEGNNSVEGDIYNKNGMHIGNDGKVDNKVYVANTTNNTQLTTEQALASTTSGYLMTELNLREGTPTVDNLPINHDEFLQFAGNVYKEAKDQKITEKENVASAIVNRKDTHSLGGTWTKTLDSIMSSKDSHAAKMDPNRVNPNRTDVLSGTSIKLTKIKTGNYQDFMNSSSSNRTSKMLDAISATISGLTLGDRVGGSNEWRGRGSYNAFGKEGQSTKNYKKYP